MITDWFFWGDVFEIINTRTRVVVRCCASRAVADSIVGRRKTLRIRHLHELRSRKSYGHCMRVEVSS